MSDVWYSYKKSLSFCAVFFFMLIGVFLMAPNAYAATLNFSGDTSDNGVTAGDTAKVNISASMDSAKGTDITVSWKSYVYDRYGHKNREGSGSFTIDGDSKQASDTVYISTSTSHTSYSVEATFNYDPYSFTKSKGPIALADADSSDDSSSDDSSHESVEVAVANARADKSQVKVGEEVTFSYEYKVTGNTGEKSVYYYIYENDTLVETEKVTTYDADDVKGYYTREYNAVTYSPTTGGTLKCKFRDVDLTYETATDDITVTAPNMLESPTISRITTPSEVSQGSDIEVEGVGENIEKAYYRVYYTNNEYADIEVDYRGLGRGGNEVGSDWTRSNISGELNVTASGSGDQISGTIPGYKLENLNCKKIALKVLVRNTSASDYEYVKENYYYYISNTSILEDNTSDDSDADTSTGSPTINGLNVRGNGQVGSDVTISGSGNNLKEAHYRVYYTTDSSAQVTNQYGNGWGAYPDGSKSNSKWKKSSINDYITVDSEFNGDMLNETISGNKLDDSWRKIAVKVLVSNKEDFSNVTTDDLYYYISDEYILSGEGSGSGEDSDEDSGEDLGEDSGDENTSTNYTINLNNDNFKVGEDINLTVEGNIQESGVRIYLSNDANATIPTMDKWVKNYNLDSPPWDDKGSVDAYKIEDGIAHITVPGSKLQEGYKKIAIKTAVKDTNTGGWYIQYIEGDLESQTETEGEKDQTEDKQTDEEKQESEEGYKVELNSKEIKAEESIGLTVEGNISNAGVRIFLSKDANSTIPKKESWIRNYDLESPWENKGAIDAQKANTGQTQITIPGDKLDSQYKKIALKVAVKDKDSGRWYIKYLGPYSYDSEVSDDTKSNVETVSYSGDITDFDYDVTYSEPDTDKPYYQSYLNPYFNIDSRLEVTGGGAVIQPSSKNSNYEELQKAYFEAVLVGGYLPAVSENAKVRFPDPWNRWSTSRDAFNPEFYNKSDNLHFRCSTGTASGSTGYIAWVGVNTYWSDPVTIEGITSQSRQISRSKVRTRRINPDRDLSELSGYIPGAEKQWIEDMLKATGNWESRYDMAMHRNAIEAKAQWKQDTEKVLSIIRNWEEEYKKSLDDDAYSKDKENDASTDYIINLKDDTFVVGKDIDLTVEGNIEDSGVRIYLSKDANATVPTTDRWVKNYNLDSPWYDKGKVDAYNIEDGKANITVPGSKLQQGYKKIAIKVAVEDASTGEWYINYMEGKLESSGDTEDEANDTSSDYTIDLVDSKLRTGEDFDLTVKGDIKDSGVRIYLSKDANATVPTTGRWVKNYNLDSPPWADKGKVDAYNIEDGKAYITIPGSKLQEGYKKAAIKVAVQDANTGEWYINFIEDRLDSENNLASKAQERIEDALVLKLNSSMAYVNGEKRTIDTQDSKITPFVQNGRTLLPARFISESLGAEVDWDGPINTATITLGDREVVIKIGSKELKVNGDTKTIDVSAQIKYDATYLPLRALAESLGKEVFWDAGTQLIIISDEENIIDQHEERDLILELYEGFEG